MTIIKAGVIGLFVVLLCGAAARAGMVTSPNGKFSIWTPDPWTVTKKRSGITAENPKQSVYVVAAPVGVVDADNLDEQARAFVDNEIDDMKITKDEESKYQGFPARTLQGTGRDEGDDIVFQCIVVDPGGDRDVLAVLIYGDAKAMQENNAVEKILSSLKPL
ncbi:MAG TPA: LpqN/LpqT family lipoprotein [Stellaceae bacterium]|nr:LpqN/LpqT family lipoprotein [Stellaceae bacterium]